jgi:hypothetical protein
MGAAYATMCTTLNATSSFLVCLEMQGHVMLSQRRRVLACALAFPFKSTVLKLPSLFA